MLVELIGGVKMKKVSIEFTQGQLDDLYLALDLAIGVLDIEGQGEKEQFVLHNFKKRVHEESMKLDGIL